MNGKTNVMMGTDPGGQGGVAAVVRVYRAAGFLDRWSVRYLTSRRLGSPLRKAAAGASAFAELLGLSVRGRVALLHTHSASRTSFRRKSLALAIGRAVGAPTVFHLHGGEFEVFFRKASPALRWWIRHTLERSSAVIVLSERWRRFVQEIAPGARITVIPNPVLLPPEVPPPDPVDGRRILFLGRVEQQKGIFALVDAVARLVPEFPDLILAVGGGGDASALRAHVDRAGLRDRIEILGFIGPEARQRELRRATAFALPSFNEGLPMALLEAMAASRPVVTTPVGGIPDVVRHGREGLLVPPGDVQALAAALRTLIADPALCRQLGAQGRATVAAGYSAEVALDRLSRVYQSLGAPEPVHTPARTRNTTR
jgi:glycosyltransferase involved in cell wall biosynthesis